MRPAVVLPLMLCAALFFGARPAYGQFEIGTTTIEFVDPDRNGRSISVRIKYPAEVSGTDVAPAAGEHPILAWGHGLTVGVDSYAPLWEALVPAGFVIALPRTESTFGANPLALGRDLAFVIVALQAASDDAGSILYQAIDTTVSAIGGHSMGGGAATLGAAENPWIDTLVSMAALETAPSAVAAAANISMPVLAIGGLADCVTPLATNQGAIYHAIVGSPCKYLVRLVGGTHCGFLQAGSPCDGFEGQCPTDAAQRKQQLAQMASLMLPWLDEQIGDDGTGLARLQEFLDADQNHTSESSCQQVPTRRESVGDVRRRFGGKR